MEKYKRNKYVRNLIWLPLMLFFIIGCNDKKECEKKFYQNGKLKEEICQENGVYHERGYDIEGNILGESIIDKEGKKQGLYKEYFINGKIKIIAQYSDDSLNGVLKAYFENGNIKQEAVYSNGKKNGYYKLYYSNNKLKMDAICENGVALYYKQFDSVGTLKKEYHGLKVQPIQGDTISKGTSYKAKILLVGALDRNKKWELSTLLSSPNSSSIRHPLSNNNSIAQFESPKLNTAGECDLYIFSTIDTYNDSIMLVQRFYVK
ncbi:MAG: hypothetical protein JWQ66_3145 [Mucilaginibacter sp.]|nr:hypothetical protein [Mucilaginibacter sp.]